MGERVYIAGHNGMVGSALLRKLSKADNLTLIYASKGELDLMNFEHVRRYIRNQSPDQIYLAAAKVGGIYANNTYPAEFIMDNLSIQLNVLKAAHECGVKKLLFLGSSCIYPKMASQPMVEADLLTGKLEPTNEPYALAKIAGIKMCESYNRQYGLDYRCVMPTNLYGENDNFNLQNSHVVPAMIRRFHEAKAEGASDVIVWGSGKPMREFLHVDDLAAACVHIMNLSASVFRGAVRDTMSSHINIGTGVEISIADLANVVANVVGFEGSITFDQSKPDGAPRKLLDVSLLESLGWHYSINLEEGLERTYNWYLRNVGNSRN